MEDTWRVVIFTIFLSLAIVAVFRRRRRSLPPGPAAFPLLGNLVWLTSKATEFESVLEDLWSKYGSVVRIQLGSLPIIMVADRDLAHKMLVQHGAIFADRPTASFLRLLASNYGIISTSGYGPRWRLLRRNLAVEILSPARVKNMADAREWALKILVDELRSQAGKEKGVVVIREAFRYSIFSLMVFICFGEKMGESAVREIEAARRDLLGFTERILVFEMAPIFARFFYRGRWKSLLQLLQRQKEIFLPLIRSRRQKKRSRVPGENSFRFSYLDSLLDLEIPEEDGRKLSDEEITYLCAEFLDGGTETTATALEWIMANVVRSRSLQEKLAVELGKNTTEEDLQKKPYLKAVVLEGLRRHPPSNFLIQHAATEDICVGGYTIPRGMNIDYAVASVNRNKEIWPDPLEFKPERFLPGGEGEEIDMTGSKNIQMLTFGAGRRICPGMNLALLHLEFFVGNLVALFWWEATGEVDMAEKTTEFTVSMKTPLSARISRRCWSRSRRITMGEDMFDGSPDSEGGFLSLLNF